MPRLRLKIVPDDQPNAPGHWIRRTIPAHVLDPKSMLGYRHWNRSNPQWDELTRRGPKGFHVVAYRRSYRK